jgi:hypothetical protein
MINFTQTVFITIQTGKTLAAFARCTDDVFIYFYVHFLPPAPE